VSPKIPVAGYTWETPNPKIEGVALIREYHRLSPVITRILPDHKIQKNEKKQGSNGYTRYAFNGW
jgi:hypothetical protein